MEFPQIADIDGAFNNILSCSIIYALTGLGIDHLSVHLIRQILVNRSVEATLGGSSIQTSRGEPRKNTYDVAVAFVGKFPHLLCDLMPEKLGMLSAWVWG